MANGDVLLDASGNVILDSSGNVMLDDGSGNSCCCGSPCPTTCSTPTSITVSLWSLARNTSGTCAGLSCFCDISNAVPGSTVGIWNQTLILQSGSCSWVWDESNFTSTQLINGIGAMERSDGSYMEFDITPGPAGLACSSSNPAYWTLIINALNDSTGGPGNLSYTRLRSGGVTGVYNYTGTCPYVPATFTLS